MDNLLYLSLKPRLVTINRIYPVISNIKFLVILLSSFSYNFDYFLFLYSFSHSFSFKSANFGLPLTFFMT